ncbi:MAG: Holliday junction resolvase Hjc [Candidatus Pacearchaeota archaeon]|nr:Holliday junction resolvase Hjc [Candidatus Pacearchaeota archaeon]
MNKKRGADAERELLHLLSQHGFAVARVAGSGMIEETCCDLFAGNGKKRCAIEVKISSNHKKYLDKEQIKGLVEFAEKFGLMPIVAIKFLRKGWWFIEPEKLEKTSKALAISFEDIEKRGKSFEEFVR